MQKFVACFLESAPVLISSLLSSSVCSWHIAQLSHKFLTLRNVYCAGILESVGQLLSLSTPLSQPHAPAGAEDGSAGMPAIPASPLMATSHHVATTHDGKLQVVLFTSSRSVCDIAACT